MYVRTSTYKYTKISNAMYCIFHVPSSGKDQNLSKYVISKKRKIVALILCSMCNCCTLDTNKLGIVHLV